MYVWGVTILKQEVNKFKVKVKDLRDQIKMQNLHMEINSNLISQHQELENRVS